MKIISKKNFSIASDFKKQINSKTRKINLSFEFNKKNSILYLKKSWRLKKIVSKYNWIKYNEPEHHLDQITLLIKKNLKIESKKIFCSSYKDISLKKRLNSKCEAYILGKNKKNFKGVEFCQQEINKIKLKKKYDVILCRHILEHAFDRVKFIKNLEKIATKDALYYFEVPDCEKLIKKNDYLMIWEEHLIYFFKSTLIHFLENNGFKVLKFIKIKQKHEDLLCVIAKKKFSKIINKKKIFKIRKKQILLLVENYKKNFIKTQNKIQNFFKNHKNSKIILFGAGHTANTFINLFNLSSKINYIVDQNRNKIGKYFPGTRIKIIGIKQYKKIKSSKICLLSSDPDKDYEIENNLKDELAKIYSIITNSEKSIL